MDYDRANDIFFISNGNKVKHSVDIGDFVLDIDYKGKACGIEVFDASENLGIGREVLSELKKSEMSVLYRRNHVLMKIILKGREVNISIPLDIA